MLQTLLYSWSITEMNDLDRDFKFLENLILGIATQTFFDELLSLV